MYQGVFFLSACSFGAKENKLFCMVRESKSSQNFTLPKEKARTSREGRSSLFGCGTADPDYDRALRRLYI